jgi:hypothetical protein
MQRKKVDIRYPAAADKRRNQPQDSGQPKRLMETLSQVEN